MNESDKSTKSKAPASPISTAKVKESIIAALSHNEAEDGLYFRNFTLLHEEDQRPSVKAGTKELLIALNELLGEGKVKVDFDDLEITFRIA